MSEAGSGNRKNTLHALFFDGHVTTTAQAQESMTSRTDTASEQQSDKHSAQKKVKHTPF